MTFSYKFKTLKIRNLYDSRAQIEMSAHEEEVTGEVEANEENSAKFSVDLVNESIKTSLEPLHAQISALTEMMDRLIQNSSARETTAVSSRETRPQYELSLSGVPGFSRFLTVTPLNTAGYSPDFRRNLFFRLGTLFPAPVSKNIYRRFL